MVAGDNRGQLNAAAAAAESAADQERLKAETEALWDGLELTESFESLATAMGTTWTEARKHPLIIDLTEGYEDVRGVARPVRLGARRVQCRFGDELETNTNIRALRGEVLFYRTRQGSSDAKEEFNEAGFFCFVVQTFDPEVGKIKPSIVYGDIDAAKWPHESDKVLSVTALSPDSRDRERLDRPEFGPSVLGTQKRVMRKPQRGVFLQHQDPYIDTQVPIMRDEVQTHMLRFFDIHQRPLQTDAATIAQVRPKLQEAREEYRDAPPGAMTAFDIALGGLRLQAGQRPEVVIDTSLLEPFAPWEDMSDYERVLRGEEDFPWLGVLRKTLGTRADLPFDAAASALLHGIYGEELRTHLARTRVTLGEMAQLAEFRDQRNARLERRREIAKKWGLA